MIEEFIGDEFLKQHGVSIPYTFICEDEIIGKPFDIKKYIEVFGKSAIPSKAGIYHLFYEDQLVYIGMTTNLRNRLVTHIKDEDMLFKYCLWFVMDNYTISEILRFEHKMIKYWKPALNTRHTNCT